MSNLKELSVVDNTAGIDITRYVHLIAGFHFLVRIVQKEAANR